jgi:hypothetical protein
MRNVTSLSFAVATFATILSAGLGLAPPAAAKDAGSEPEHVGVLGAAGESLFGDVYVPMRSRLASRAGEQRSAIPWAKARRPL